LMTRLEKLLVVVVALLVLATGAVLAVAAVGHPERLEYFIKALEYGLKGLEAYLNFVKDLFIEAITK